MDSISTVNKSPIILVHSDEWFGKVLKDTFESYGYESFYLSTEKEALAKFPALAREDAVAFIDWDVALRHGVDFIKSLIESSISCLKKVFLISKGKEELPEIRESIESEMFSGDVELFEINSDNMVKLFTMLESGIF